MPLTGDEHFDSLVSAAPVHFAYGISSVDWSGYAALLQSLGIDLGSVLAVTWCGLNNRNIEATDLPEFTVVHSGGIVCSEGKKKLFSDKFNFSEIRFGMCKGFAPHEYSDPRGYGKYCIEFSGPGNILIGRLEWHWRAKRFRDNRMEIMAVASERDRILEVLTNLLGG